MSKEERTKNSEAAADRVGGLIVDFDYTFVDGISLLKDVATRVLSSGGVAVTPMTFTRKLFGFKTVSAINALLGAASKTSTEQAVSAMASEMDEAIGSGKVNAQVLDVCRKAMAGAVDVIFVTARSPEVVEKKLASAGLPETRVIKVERCDRFGEYALDAWVRAARAIHVTARECTVIAATAMSIRQAVMAGMQTIAFVNPIITYQDFSGADLIIEGDEPEPAVEPMMNLILP